jgi:hypothetical protein
MEIHYPQRPLQNNFFTREVWQQRNRVCIEFFERAMRRNPPGYAVEPVVQATAWGLRRVIWFTGLLGCLCAWITWLISDLVWLQAWHLCLGFISWTYLEYVVHRFVIRGRWFSRSYPRLAQKCSRGIYFNRMQRMHIMLVLIILVMAGLGVQLYFMDMAGLAMGWLWYSYSRVLVQWQGCRRYFPGLYLHHIYHEAGYNLAGFGWSTIWWDKIFCTSPTLPATERQYQR